MKQKLIPNILKRCDKAVRIIVPLAYFLACIIMSRNFAPKLHFTQEFIAVLNFVEENTDEDELETCSWTFGTSTYDTQHPEPYPAIYKYNKIARVMLFYALTSLNPKSIAIDKEFLAKLALKLLQANFSKELGKNEIMPSSPQHKRRLRVWKTLIYIAPMLDEPTLRSLEQDIWSCLLHHNLLDVRFLMDLFYVYIALNNDFAIDSLSARAKKYNERQQILSSIVAMIGNLLLNAKDEQQLQLFVEKLFPYMRLYMASFAHAVKINAQFLFHQFYMMLKQQNSAFLEKQSETWKHEAAELFRFIQTVIVNGTYSYFC
jgi:hypothetical protein